MRHYLVEDIDEARGALMKRRVDSVWLHEKLIESSARIFGGMASNLDLRMEHKNPEGCFVEQDAQIAFYELIGGAPNESLSLDQRAWALLFAAAVLEADYLAI